VDKSLKKQEHEAPKVEKSSKDYLALVDTFRVFKVQLGEAIAQNSKTTKLMNHIEEGLGTISSAPSGGSTKPTIKARLSDSFAGKETKTK